MISFPNRDHRLPLGTHIKKFKREQVYVRVKNCFSGQTWNRGRSLRLEPVVQEGRHPSVQFLVDCLGISVAFKIYVPGHGRHHRHNADRLS